MKKSYDGLSRPSRTPFDGLERPSYHWESRNCIWTLAWPGFFVNRSTSSKRVRGKRVTATSPRTPRKSAGTP